MRASAQSCECGDFHLGLLVRDALRCPRGRRVAPSMRGAILEISERCAALPDLDTRSADVILGYSMRPSVSSIRQRARSVSHRYSSSLQSPWGGSTSRRSASTASCEASDAAVAGLVSGTPRRRRARNADGAGRPHERGAADQKRGPARIPSLRPVRGEPFFRRLRRSPLAERAAPGAAVPRRTDPVRGAARMALRA